MANREYHPPLTDIEKLVRERDALNRKIRDLERQNEKITSGKIEFSHKGSYAGNWWSMKFQRGTSTCILAKSENLKECIDQAMIVANDITNCAMTARHKYLEVSEDEI